MSLPSKFKILGIGTLVSLMGLVFVIKVSKVHGQKPPPCLGEWVTALQHGIQSEAPCPTRLNDIATGVSSLSSFTRYRCGFALSSAVQQRLIQLEQQAWPGNCDGVCRLTRQDIKEIITDQYLGLAATLTDDQISAMAHSFRMVAAWVPANRSPDVMLDSSGPNVSQSDFTQTLKLLRSGDIAIQAAAIVEIASQVDHLCDVLAYALPGEWNVSYYSPYRVYVVAYSLVCGDKLVDSYTECETRMINTQNWLTSQGFNAPWEGKPLWGDAGYFYSRPVSILFSDDRQTELLDRYAGVHGVR